MSPGFPGFFSIKFRRFNVNMFRKDALEWRPQQFIKQIVAYYKFTVLKYSNFSCDFVENQGWKLVVRWILSLLIRIMQL